MWTHSSWGGAWWLLVFAGALLVIWLVPLRRHGSQEREQEDRSRGDENNRAERR